MNDWNVSPPFENGVKRETTLTFLTATLLDITTGTIKFRIAVRLLFYYLVIFYSTIYILLRFCNYTLMNYILLKYEQFYNLLPYLDTY